MSREIVFSSRSAGRKRQRSHDGGFTLFEVMVALMLLSAVGVTLVPTLQWIKLQREASRQRETARLEVANIMERFTSQSWEDIDREAAQSIKLSPNAANILPHAELKVTVTREEEDYPRKRITVQLTWTNRGGERVSPVQLTTWRYQQNR